jgi:hypothetical protein
LEEKVAAPAQKIEITVAGIRHADHVALSILKFGNTFTDKRRSVGIVHSWTQATELMIRSKTRFASGVLKRLQMVSLLKFLKILQ